MTTTTTKQIDELADAIMNLAVEMAKKYEIQPILHVFHGKDVHIIPVEGDPIHFVPLAVQALKPDAYILIAECRIKKVSPGEWEEMRKDRRRGDIADDIENPELVLVISMPKGGPPSVWTADVGPMRKLGPWVKLDTENAFKVNYPVDW